MEYEIFFSPEAQADLINIHNYISERSGPNLAAGYIDRIETFCNGFDVAAERGTKRDDLRPGLRIVGFERRVAIAFRVDGRRATIVRILYGGRDLGRIFDDR